jgi:hypothetical protein
VWLVIGVVLTLTACDRPTDADRQSAQKAGSKYASLSTGPGTPPMPFVSGSTIVGLPGGASLALQATPSGGLAGWLAPAVVPSPDGGFVAYNDFTYLVPVDFERSWSEQGIHPGDPIATPSIHLVDLASGSDTVLARGAFSLAWRADGALAYVQRQAETYKADQPFLGDVVVRPSAGTAPEVWTEAPGQYIVAAWAGSRLLVYRESEGEGIDLLALDGPGRSQVLAPGANLVAVSPDGSQVLVSQDGAASLLDVASGETLATLDLLQSDPVTGQPIQYLAYGGSWVGDEIAAEGGPGVVILRVTSSSISLTDAIRLSPNTFPMPPHEPRLNADGSTVVAWIPLPGTRGGRNYSYLACVIATHSCTQGPVTNVIRFYAVYNPSRPIS